MKLSYEQSVAACLVAFRAANLSSFGWWQDSPSWLAETAKLWSKFMQAKGISMPILEIAASRYVLTEQEMPTLQRFIDFCIACESEYICNVSLPSTGGRILLVPVAAKPGSPIGEKIAESHRARLSISNHEVSLATKMRRTEVASQKAISNNLPLSELAKSKTMESG